MMSKKPNFAALLEAFFTDRLMRQRQASPHTIASYRDTFRLLLRFGQEHLKKSPSTLALEDLDAPFIGAFLDHLEKENGIVARSRNQRLAAIRSFFHYAAFEMPDNAALIQRVLAMPSKRYDRAQVGFLTRDEVEALLTAPDRTTWAGRRDHALLSLTVQTGLRVSELVNLTCEDVTLGTGAHVRCHGKGRKERCTPLTKRLATALAEWLRERRGMPSDWLFTSARGHRLSTDGVQYILRRHVNAATRACPSLQKKKVSPHTLRHTTAMHFLQAGVDITTIALWLGHESIETTQVYLDANLALKEEILAKTAPVNAKKGRFRPDDPLMTFLKSL